MVRPARHIVRNLRELTGPQRAAVLVMYLAPPVARRLLAQLSSGEIRQISCTIDSLEEIAPSIIEEVVDDFLAEFRETASAATSRPSRSTVVRTAAHDNIEINHDFAVKIGAESAHRVAATLEGLEAEVAAAALSLMGNENAQRVTYAMPTATRRHLARLSTRLQTSRFEALSSEACSRVIEQVETGLRAQREAERQRGLSKPERGVPTARPGIIGRESLSTLVAQPSVKTGVEALIRHGNTDSAGTYLLPSPPPASNVATEGAVLRNAPDNIATASGESPLFPETAYEAFAALIPASVNSDRVRPDPTGRHTRVPGVLELVRVARSHALAAASSGDAASQVAYFIDALPFQAASRTPSVAKARLPKRAPNAQRAPLHRLPREERRRVEATARNARTLSAVNITASHQESATVRLADVMKSGESHPVTISPIAWMAMQLKSAAPRTEKSPTLSLLAPSPTRNR